MTYLECLKEDEKYRKVSEAVSDYPDLSAKLMGAIMQHDCCIKLSENFEEILTKELPCKYTQEELNNIVENSRIQAYEVLVPVENEVILEAIKRKKAELEKYEANLMDIYKENSEKELIFVNATDECKESE
ncbi:hypothetical protein [Butyrivibrio sp. LB2008]|uniref:hypothetical protein n=1 Tax=Butyrivibrio sp. LB2008 TaxID=1408305 RepID=UPI00047E28F4|nr:hypothetical protein [Butyrivibrio sp. LB2008]